ncbi:hypothetical protein L6R46_02205 [Myxococcota bacterium]|jgi:hypothetical protein|nr:hypothetical protein [Myxococcota bacterium]
MNSDAASQHPEDAVQHDAEGQDTLPSNDALTAASDDVMDHHHTAAGAICAGTIAQAVGLAALNAAGFLQNAETLATAALAQALAKGEGASRSEEEIFAALAQATAHFQEVITFALHTADRVARRSE